ncbi:hypothetical protein [Streptomyces sp. SID2119]|uniref:hypothetical protein n=1 Tax=Streptomyces sp. SID2119 TaxID=2690253 RepID=UPI00136A225F|nr:hypothetical protein [Streptomyces sp. SID2119]MYW28326.1 hypothetical protein [Streptomyces sp. SID2119]
MSARNTLLDLFLHGGDGSQPEFEQALDDYAHELAEKIRTQKLRAPEGFVHRQTWVDAWSEGRDDMADLIDPEAP